MLRSLFLSIILIVTSLSHAQEDSVVDSMTVLFKKNNAFCFDLYTQLQTPTSNLIYSPFSIFSALSMVYVGADQNTEKVMKKTLHLQFDQQDLSNAYAEFFKTKDDSRLHIANALWADLGTYFSPEYLKRLTTDFHADAAIIDFNQKRRSVSIINGWIKNQTEGKIPSLIQANDLDESTRLVLTNAIYFKGQWKLPFNPKKTLNAPFYTTENQITLVPMMHQTGRFLYFDDNIFQIISLPFERDKTDNARLSCIIFLPHDKENLTLSKDTFSNALKKLKSTNVALTLPKFTLRQRFNLNATLKKLGMAEAFTSRADFSKIDGLHDLLLSQVVHEAFFALDEKGVVAAAATAAAMGTTAVGPSVKPITFKADHPFIIAIVDLDTHGILFLGKLYRPQGEPSE